MARSTSSRGSESKRRRRARPPVATEDRRRLGWAREPDHRRALPPLPALVGAVRSDAGRHVRRDGTARAPGRSGHRADGRLRSAHLVRRPRSRPTSPAPASTTTSPRTSPDRMPGTIAALGTVTPWRGDEHVSRPRPEPVASSGSPGSRLPTSDEGRYLDDGPAGVLGALHGPRHPGVHPPRRNGRRPGADGHVPARRGVRAPARHHDHAGALRPHGHASNGTPACGFSARTRAERSARSPTALTSGTSCATTRRSGRGATSS